MGMREDALVELYGGEERTNYVDNRERIGQQLFFLHFLHDLWEVGRFKRHLHEGDGEKRRVDVLVLLQCIYGIKVVGTEKMATNLSYLSI